MRTIKFRAWDTSHEKTALGSKMWYWKSGEQEFDLSAELQKPTCHIMQYTNLKDKNGKEIWEGDIVKVLDYSKPRKELFRMKVSWNNGSAGFNIVGGEFDSLYEIIGNIYEHPELLSKGGGG